MQILNKRIAANCDAVISNLAAIGYDKLIEEPYEFPDYFSNRALTRIAAAVAFGRTPHSYDNACFAVVISEGLPGNRKFISGFRALGAPRALEIREDVINHWRVGRRTSDTVLAESYRPEELPEVFRRNEHSWEPEEVLRLKNHATPSHQQVDFVDLGLIPALEEHVKDKLGPLLQRIVSRADREFAEKHGQSVDHIQLLRLVFRSLAGKVMNDRGIVQIGSLPPDADYLLKKVDSHYGDRTTTIEDKSTRQLVVDQLWNATSLKNISVEVLAYIWETAFVTDEFRTDQSIHATPPSIARYITRRLPIENIPRDDRRIVDPCCGSGTFLVAAMHRLRELLPTAMSEPERHEYVKPRLRGFDIDRFGLEIARSCLMLADFPNPNGWQLTPEDVLDIENARHFSSALQDAGVVLCNPPFGELTSEERAALKPTSVLKQVELFHNTLSRIPTHALLGFVMPLQFCSGASYRSVRKMLAERYEEVEIVTLPDSAFAIADQETALVIAKSPRHSPKQSVSVLHRKVSEWKAWNDFNQRYAVSSEDSGRLSVEQCEASIALPDLNAVWSHFSTRHSETVAGITEFVHRGIEWNVNLRENRDLLIRSEPETGYVPGLPSAPKGAFQSYECPPTAYLNVMEDYQKTPFPFQLPWGEPKVVMNAKRRSRFPWRISAFSDTSGLVCYQSYTALWPTNGWGTTVLAAVLNGYVANAFVASHESSRDITFDTVKAIPVPALNTAQHVEIDALVNQYREVVETPPTPLSGQARDDRALVLLDQIDAAVLKAYQLPATLVTALLEYFKGKSRYRAVPLDFDGPSKSLIRAMNKKAVSLIDEWSEERSDFDAQAWPQIKEAIEDDRMSTRKRFHG